MVEFHDNNDNNILFLLLEGYVQQLKKKLNRLIYELESDYFINSKIR